MPVLKNKTQGLYVNVSKGILKDESLNLRDRGMLITILSLPDNWNFTVAGLAKILPDGKAAINASLSRLEELGYLTKQQVRTDQGKFGSNVIEVHETPIKPFAENRSSEKRETGKPISDNPTQLNNNRLNIKELNNKNNYIGSKNKESKIRNFEERQYENMEELTRRLIACS